MLSGNVVKSELRKFQFKLIKLKLNSIFIFAEFPTSPSPKPSNASKPKAVACS